ncbi:hypothetical protein ARALYDRAFT_355494 [Arabidopsis lyrata subsp. lyrata]|uniref:TF-B3 domain-containing protein n=1 Tax=Arabidopsis lyrata subsp. lyrata TaxID=81972 RepID=D7MHL0_ARALL|nr:hypothetical protein ARALYDRAFT_355494 [Arabidopsis lyrata subsp. lyrata]
MANSMFSSSAKPHFLKPILPGFKTYILIPKAFYSKYLEGRQEGNAAELRSDASEITWNIKIDGRRMTKGWEEFAVGHNLQVGDILVFRHEGNLLFHVTPFGLSCCEILYSQNDEKVVKDKTGKVTRYKTVKKTAKNECSSVDTDFVYLPRGFTTSSGLSKLCNEIILMDEKSRPSTLKLCYHKSRKPPVLRIYPLERDEDNIGNHSKKIKQEVEHETVKEETNVESGKLKRDGLLKKDPQKVCSSSHDTIFVVPGTASNQRNDSFHLPKGFTTSSGLSKLCKKIIFMDEKDNRFTVRRGWRGFCCRNGHKTGCFLRLILVRNGKTPVLRIFPLEKDESSIGKNSKEIKQEVEHESAKEEKNVESLSLSDNSSFVVSVTVSNLREDILYLPIRLSRSNILDKKFHEISLMNKQGRTWTLSLKYSKSSGKFRITHGWKSFCEANGQNAGCTFLFNLVRNRTSPVLLMTSLWDDIHQSKTASFDNSVGPRRSSMGQEVKIMG